MTWSSFHRRGEVLRHVVAVAQARRDGVLPVDVDGVGAVFADDLDLLGALQLSWHTRLMGRIESRQMDQPVSLEDAVTGAWQDAYDELGGVRLVLDRAREAADDRVRYAMTRAAAKEQLALAVAAGLGNPGDPGDLASQRVGLGIEQRARETYVPGSRGGVQTAGAAYPSGVWERMVDRLRSLAA